MKLSQIKQLRSVQAINSTLSRMATSQASIAWGQFKKQQRALPYANTNANAFTTVNETDAKIAQHGRAFFQMVAELDSRSFVIDVPQVLEFVCSSGAKPKTDKQIADIAKASGLTESAVRKSNDDARMKSITLGNSLKASFVSRFGEYEFSDTDNEVDLEISAEAVLKVIEGLRVRIAGWDKPDMAELMLLKGDADIVDTIAIREAEYGERAGEGSREQDDKMLSGSDMGAAALVK